MIVVLRCLLEYLLGPVMSLIKLNYIDADSEVNDLMLQASSRLSGIRELHVSKEISSEFSAEVLADSKGLESRAGVLHVGCMHLSSRGMEGIGGMAGLARLDIQVLSVAEGGFAHLQRLAGLRELSIECSKMGAEDMRAVSKVAGLERLCLRVRDMESGCLVHLQEMQSLKELYIDCYVSDSPLDEDVMHSITGQKALTALSIRAYNIDSRCFAHLQKLASLRELSLSIRALRTENVLEIGRIASLKRLRVSVNEIDREMLESLRKLDKVVDLEVRPYRVCESPIIFLEEIFVLRMDKMSELGKMASLERLAIRAQNIGAEHLSQLRGLAKLRELHVRTNELTAEAVQEIGKITSLERLGIATPYIERKSMVHLKSLSNLKELSIAGLARDMIPEFEVLEVLRHIERLSIGARDIGPAVFARLRSMEGLQELSVCTSRIDKASMAELGGMQGLTRLCIRVHKIEDTGSVSALLNLASLEELDIRWCWSIGNLLLLPTAREAQDRAERREIESVLKAMHTRGVSVRPRPYRMS